MKVVIFGGRDYQMTHEDWDSLDAFRVLYRFTEIVSGGCGGADKSAEDWAARREIRVKTFLPDWKKHSRAAGPIRNREMAEYADMGIAFPGGAGTLDMIKQMRSKNKPVVCLDTSIDLRQAH